MFFNWFDASYAIRLQQNIPSSIVTNSDSLFKVIVRSSSTIEKRFMIYLQAALKASHECKMNKMGWIKSSGNLVGWLTKINKPELIQRIMRKGKQDNIADQWVIRP